jgi:integral membrane protein
LDSAQAIGCLPGAVGRARAAGNHLRFAAGRPEEHFMSSIKTLRYVALAEATSFLVLLLCVYFKYGQDSPAGVKVMGPIHGMLFLAYVYVAAIMARPKAGWSNQTTLYVLIGAVLPFGGFVVDRWLVRTHPAAA